MEASKSKIIKEIAQNLNCGHDSYYNTKTEEIIEIPNFSDFYDEEEFKSDLKTIKKNKKDFIKIEPLESFESFEIMENFIAQLPESQLKIELETILQRKKPFQNFKNSIDNSDFREQWLKFKQNELEKIVEKIIKLEIENSK